MPRISVLLVGVLCLAQGLGCKGATEAVVDEAPPPAVSTDFSRLPDILTGIQKSAKVLLYAGLPSEFWEPELRAKDLAQKETLDVHGHPVLEEPLALSDADAEKLTELLSASESYQSVNNNRRKKCGGFTAEYCIEWTTGEKVTQLLICLECGDVMLFGPQSDLQCDLSPDAAQRLTDLLTPYHKSRLSE